MAEVEDEFDGPHPLTPSPNLGRRGITDDEYDWRRRGPDLNAPVVVRGRVWTEIGSGEIWIPIERVAFALGLGVRAAVYQAETRRVHRRWAIRRSMGPVADSAVAESDRNGRRGRYCAMYLLSDVLRLQSARESRAWSRCHSPNDPEWPNRPQSYRKLDDIPPNGQLITVEDVDALKISSQRGDAVVLNALNRFSIATAELESLQDYKLAGVVAGKQIGWQAALSAVDDLLK